MVKVPCYKSGGRWFDPRRQWIFDIKSFRSNYGPGVDTASNRNEYQEYFLGGKGGRYLKLTTYHHSVPLSRNLRTLTSWNTLGLSRPVMGLLYLYLRQNWLLYDGSCCLHSAPLSFNTAQSGSTVPTLRSRELASSPVPEDW